MPMNLHGFGTAMLRASRKRTVVGNGAVQFDAVEAVVLLFLPVVPYRVIHVMNTDGRQYVGVKLRFSGRVIAKAFLLRWALGAAAIGAFFALIAGFEIDAPNAGWMRPALGGGAGLVAGAMFFGAWWWMEREDDRWRRLFGVTPLGSSDPCDWPADEMEEVAGHLRGETGKADLGQAADVLAVRGEMAKAAVCARLAQAMCGHLAGFAAKQTLDRLRRQAEAGKAG